MPGQEAALCAPGPRGADGGAAEEGVSGHEQLERLLDGGDQRHAFAGRTHITYMIRS